LFVSGWHFLEQFVGLFRPLGLGGFGGFHRVFGGFLCRSLVIEFEEAGEEVFAGLGGDGVAGAVVLGGGFYMLVLVVVFGEGFDLLEVVGEVDGGAVGTLFVPGVGGQDGLVELAVEVAEVVDGVAGLGLGEAAGGGAVFGRDFFGAVPIAGLGALLVELVEAGVEIGGVEEVVNVGEAEPEAEHEAAAVLVIALADGGGAGNSADGAVFLVFMGICALVG
jgi:hypothetical protein